MRHKIKAPACEPLSLDLNPAWVVLERYTPTHSNTKGVFSMPPAPHNQVDTPANDPTPISPIETMISLSPLGKAEDVLGTGILLSPRRSPFFSYSLGKSSEWNPLELYLSLVGWCQEDTLWRLHKGHWSRHAIPCCHLELASKNVVFMFLAPKPVGKHEFSDILNAQGFKSATGQDTGPQTLKSLKKEKNKSDDPIKAKVIFSWKIFRALIGLFSSSIRGRNLKFEVMQWWRD